MSAIVIVSSDAAALRELYDAVERRFAHDYTVIPVAGVHSLAGALSSDDSIAVAMAPVGTPDFRALSEIGTRDAGARRIAIVRVGDTSVAEELSRAMTLGHVEYCVGQPWASPEEELYPVISEALRVWSYERRLRYEKATIVDDPAAPAGRSLASMLERNGVAARLLDSTSQEGLDLLSRPLKGAELPAVLLWNGRVLSDPSATELAAALGAKTSPTASAYDVAIVGCGPAGLAAGVYASSEGLRTVTVEAQAVGGQAGTSANIRNYLGFPWGVRGADLAAAAARQSEQLGVETVVTRSAISLFADGDERVLTLSNGDVIRARCVILAGGVAYRLSGIESVDALVGHGVFYGAGASEARAMAGLRVAVLGGGNSAGQAAAHLAAAGARVSILIRGDSVAKSMSDYLVRQLEGNRHVSVRTQVQVVEAVGDGQLEALVLAGPDNDRETLVTDALYIFIGARPATEWLEGAVDVDDHGFLLTGQGNAAWLETSMPGVFAAGDIRAGSIKRVAAAVGEGSTAAMLARDHLATAHQ